MKKSKKKVSYHLRKFTRLQKSCLKSYILFLVDDRAQTVEPELRRAIQNRNAKLESDLTGKTPFEKPQLRELSLNFLKIKKNLFLAEWLALIQKRDNLLQQADKISKEKSRAKLELELIAIQFEARKIGLIAEYKKTQEHRDREFELANKCIALVQQKDQIDEEIDQIDANIISQQERHASQQQSFIDDQKRKGKYDFRL